MDYDDYKSALISTTEKRAVQFLKTGKAEGDFYYGFERAMDNDGLLQVAALILADAPKGDIRTALESAMFSDSFIEREVDSIESWRQDNIGKERYYSEKHGD